MAGWPNNKGQNHVLAASSLLIKYIFCQIGPFLVTRVFFMVKDVRWRKGQYVRHDRVHSSKLSLAKEIRLRHDQRPLSHRPLSHSHLVLNYSSCNSSIL